MTPPLGENSDQLPVSADLAAEDAAALDALIDAGFDMSAVPATMRHRCERAAQVLGLLGSISPSAANTEALVDATLARVRLASRPTTVAHEPEYALSGNDEDALESLVAHGYTPEAVPAPLRKRASRQAQVLNLLEPTPTELAGSGQVISRTLERVQAAIDKQESRLKVEHAPVGGRRFRTADLMTAAALLLIGTAAVGPMVGAAREQSRRIACQQSLQTAGLGFASYASDFQDSMPMASASVAGNPWWFVGRPEQSNSANMFTLTRTGYAGVDNLACAGNPAACRSDLGPSAQDWRNLDEVSYSYQNLFGLKQPRLTHQGVESGGRMLVVVDGSPVVRRAVRGLWINPLANSMNHAGKGQNALFSDGSVEWMTSPVLQNGDNIWLPRMIEEVLSKRGQPTQAEPIKGTEVPAGDDDRFVGP